MGLPKKGGLIMDKKSRSPRYPQMSLQDALERIRLVYEKEHIHKAEREVIAKALGYAGLNGASAAAIASLRQYGLLERIGDAMRVSDDATTILELPPGDSERDAALLRVAFTPPLFAELNENFGSPLPSDENLRLYLVKRGFASKAADNLIRTYRDTLSLVKAEGQAYDGQESTEISSRERSKVMTSTGQQNQAFPRTPMAVVAGISEDMQTRLTEHCKVRILFEGSVTQEAIDKLMKYLELGKDAFPARANVNEKEAETA